MTVCEAMNGLCREGSTGPVMEEVIAMDCVCALDDDVRLKGNCEVERKKFRRGWKGRIER